MGMGVLGRAGAATGALAATAVVAAPAGAATGPTLQLSLDPNTPTVVDLSPQGKSAGDRYAINAVVRDAAGQQVGMFRASQTSIRLTRTAETVQTEGVFDLADGTIAFAGVATSPLKATGLVTGASFPRAVIGGTGAYAGAGGQLVTRKTADGRYEQTLRLVLPDAAPTTLDLPSVTGRGARIDLDANGLTPGDLIAYSAGSADGAVLGTQSVLAPDGADLLVLSSLTAKLPTGDLAVTGLATIPAVGSSIVPGRTFVRAVTGGTRAYLGLSGTQTVQLGADGTYASQLALYRPTGATTRLTVGARSNRRASLDLGAKGLSLGDVDVVRDRLIDRRGRPNGWLYGTRTAVDVAGSSLTVESLSTFSLPGGTIVVGGVEPGFTAASVRPVLGGTGRYAAMRGELLTQPNGSGFFTSRLRLQRIG